MFKVRTKQAQIQWHPKIKKNCTILLPILENKCDSFLNDPKIARQIISEIWATSPELFPAQMTEGADKVWEVYRTASKKYLRMCLPAP